MIEMTLAQGRLEWPIPVRKARRRRDSRVATYHNTSRPSPRNSTSAASPKREYSRSNEHNPFQQQQPREQPLDLQFLDFFDLHGCSPTGNPGFSPGIHQNGQDQSSWISPSSISYTLASNPPNSPQVFDGNNASSPVTGISSQISNNGLDMSWTEAIPITGNVGSDLDNMSMPDVQIGSYGSFDSLLLATPDTGVSSISEGYGFPGMDSTFGLTETALDGLKLSDGFYHATGQVLDPSSPGTLGSPISPDDFYFESDSSMLQVDLNFGDVYSTQGRQWSSATLTQPQQNLTPQLNNSMVPRNPWNSQQAQFSPFQGNANTGNGTFEPLRGLSYEKHIAGEEYLRNEQQFFGPEPVSPQWDTDGDEWIVPSYPSSYAASHNSPHSQGSPASHTSSPPHVEIEHHSHVFSSDPRVSKPKATRGRQRNLTALEKKSAREVRDAKACWACHISKTKCSPCSPGRPCEQCARLVGKRRFCKFTCFNDPLESLHTFLVPDYNMGHFTSANVASFVANNATSWGTQQLPVRLSWGYRRLLQADVVVLALRSATSAMGFQHQAIANGAGRPLLIRKQSPPLGIPLAAMEEMEDVYSQYIRDIVQSDLRGYLSIAYDDQDSMLPERLLGAVCSFYISGLEADEECALLRRAIEMHVTSTIIERSLILDSESIQRVQDHMQQLYPPRSAPRCAQRQIKLAFFMLQRQRIISVLKDWGNMMWTIHNATNNDKRWAVGFSVFIMLTLVIDKTLGSAYYFCEGRIEHHGFEAAAERNEFRKLVRLTQTELFERCKEIFHWKFKTRKAGREACNPIRDGMSAFKGRAVDDGITGLVGDLRALAGDFDPEIRAHKTLKPDPGSADTESPYTDAGRLACIFLDDFLDPR